MIIFTLGSHSKGSSQSKVDDKFIPKINPLPSSLISADQTGLNKPCNLPSVQLSQAYSSISTNATEKEGLPLVQEETVKHNEHRRLQPWQSEILNDFFNKNARPNNEDIKNLSLKTKRNENSVKNGLVTKICA